jgi:nucleoside-diphosphate-sugar epimerase
MSTKPRVLVTGGAGYIGSVLVPILLQHKFAITVVDNFMYKQLSLLDVCHHQDLTIVVGDVRDNSLLEKHVAQHDVIIPLAAIVGAPACDRDPKLASQVNLDQIQNIANLASQDQQLIYPVTNSGYGIGGQKHCDESTPLNPISLYGRTKVEAEKILLDQASAITFRLATVFGVAPRMRLDLLVNDFVYRAYRDHFIVLFESHFRRNYLHIRDVAMVFLHALENFDLIKGSPYNVGLSNANLSKRQLCDKIKDHLPEFHIFESPIAQDPDKRDYIVSNEKIEKTGWLPKFSLDDGITELIKLYNYLPVSPHQNL